MTHRKRIKPEDRIPFRLSIAERNLVLDRAFLDHEMEERLRTASMSGSHLVAALTLDDVDELAGCVAAEANHSDEAGVRRSLYAVFGRLTKLEAQPQLLKKDWSADSRWLTLQSERDKAALEVMEIVKSSSTKSTASSPPASYREMERAFLTSAVRVPVIDVEMPTQMALWILSGLVFLNCLVLQATIERLPFEETGQREEIWLVLDAKGGLARVLATLWLAFIVASPLAVPMAVLLSIVLRTMAGGGSTIGLFSAVLFLASLAATGRSIRSRLKPQTWWW